MYTCSYTHNKNFQKYSHGLQNLMSSFKIGCQIDDRGRKFKITAGT